MRSVEEDPSWPYWISLHFYVVFCECEGHTDGW